MELEKNPERVKILGEELLVQNLQFRSFLKFSNHSDAELDAVVRRHFKDVSAQIDCRACGNCCREILPELDRADIKRLAAHLAISEQAVITRHLRSAEEKGKFTFKNAPCPFLSKNSCIVYDSRPEDCRSYPHLHKEEFRSRLLSVMENCSVCPIVFNVVERLKSELWTNPDEGDLHDEHEFDDEDDEDLEEYDDEEDYDEEDYELDAEFDNDAEGESEIDPVVNEVLDWAEEFANGPRFARLNEEQKNHAVFAIQTFASLAYDYRGDKPSDWSEGTIRECCLELIPREVCADESFFRSLSPILEAFFTFLAETDRLPRGMELARKVESLDPEIVRASRNLGNWGIVKALVMGLREAGVDPTDQEALDQFIAETNRDVPERPRESDDEYPLLTHEKGQLLFDPAPRAPAFDRYAPCPCGSGKKYKFCCGRTS